LTGTPQGQRRGVRRRGPRGRESGGGGEGLGRREARGGQEGGCHGFLAHDGGTTTRPRGDGRAMMRRREDEAVGRMGAAAAMASSHGSCCAEGHRGHDWGTTGPVLGLGNGLEGRRDLNENVNGKCGCCFVKRQWLDLDPTSLNHSLHGCTKYPDCTRYIA
jgi:hypothetical protein